MDAAIDICDMFLESGRIVSMQGRAVKERAGKPPPAQPFLHQFPWQSLLIVSQHPPAKSSLLLFRTITLATIFGERSFGKG
jgi:C-terminal processing protease CtpA/Prc